MGSEPSRKVLECREAGDPQHLEHEYVQSCVRPRDHQHNVNGERQLFWKHVNTSSDQSHKNIRVIYNQHKKHCNIVIIADVSSRDNQKGHGVVAEHLEEIVSWPDYHLDG